MSIRVDHKDLAAYSAALLESVGLETDAARELASCLVEADLRGTESHGVSRLPIYLPRFVSGATNPRPVIATAAETASASLVDGDNGIGHLVGMHAMGLAMAHARRQGIGLAVARNSNHFGAASYFTLMASRAGMIGFAASNTCPAMPAPESRSAVVGNGPFSIALPASDGEAVCLDISTSAGAYGKVLLAAREGTEIPPGWAIDIDGRPTTDPAKAIESQLLLPFAGHKGFGIAFMIDALCAALAGSWLGYDVPNIYEPGQEASPGRLSHIFLAISIDAVGTGQGFTGRIDAMKQLVHEAVPIAGERSKFPGEIELRTRRARERDGVPLSPSLARMLADLGTDAGIAPPWTVRHA